eukprot:4526421-Amphidinium_carterae.1
MSAHIAVSLGVSAQEHRIDKCMMTETDPLTEEPAKKRQRTLPRTKAKEETAAQDVIVHIENEAIAVHS